MMFPRKIQQAFTLVELLVVMAIISVLASMLLPILSSARATARDTKCIANLRSIGSALTMYLSENGNYVPACGPDDSQPDEYLVWYRAMLPFVENWAMYECPSKYQTAHDVPEEYQGNSTSPTPAADTEFHAVNYGMNFQLSGTAPNEDLKGDSIQVEDVANPGHVVFILDGAIFGGSGDGESGSSGDGQDSEKTQFELPDDKSESPDSIIEGGLYFPDNGAMTLPTGKPTVSSRHRGRTMCLFLDGHAEPVLTKDMLSVDRDSDQCMYEAQMMWDE